MGVAWMINLEKISNEIEGLFAKMQAGYEEEDWASLLQMNNHIERQLQSINIDTLDASQKKSYKQILKNTYKSHQALYSKCSEIFKETEGELGLLRKQKSAGSVYQQVQNSWCVWFCRLAFRLSFFGWYLTP